MPKRAPTPSRRCPFAECPSNHGEPSLGIVRHGFLRSRQGARLRLLCRTCRRTFCNRRGTAYYRLHHPRRLFDQFAKLLTEGLSAASLARVLGVWPSTVSRWLARASQHATAFGNEHDSVAAPYELQFDEISARPACEPRNPWIFAGIEAWSRFWVAAQVGKRNHRTTRAFVLRARQSCGTLEKPILITSDPFPFYERKIKRAFGPACVYVQVENRYRQDCMLRTTPRLVLGQQDKLEALQARSEDSKRLNTSYVERLNLFLRRSCSYLHRRTSGRVRNPQRLAMNVELLRCAYNFIKAHKSLRFGKRFRTPAMQASIFERALSWREIFAWPALPKTITIPADEDIRARSKPRPGVHAHRYRVFQSLMA